MENPSQNVIYFQKPENRAEVKNGLSQNSLLYHKHTGSPYFIDFSTLSVNFINADISEVAKLLAEKSGINVFLDESLTCKLTSNFKDIPLEGGIKRLLGPTISSAIIFDKEKSPRFQVDTVKNF